MSIEIGCVRVSSTDRNEGVRFWTLFSVWISERWFKTTTDSFSLLTKPLHLV